MVPIVTTICAFCGSDYRVQLHHVCGRPYPGHRYFNQLVLPLCGCCHAREHAVLRRLGLEWLSTGVDPVVHQLSRLTVVVGRLTDEHRPLLLAPDSVGSLHRLLVEVCDRGAT